MKVAVLDLGGTTFHLQHVLIESAAVAGCAFDDKVSLRIGQRMTPAGAFDSETCGLIVETVDRLVARSAAAGPAPLTVVATSPFRQATNGADVLARLRARGVPVRLLAAAEEAALAFAGNATEDGRTRAVVDLGGGSAEVAVGTCLRCEDVRSAPIGALRIQALLAPGRPFGAAEHALLREALLDVTQELTAGVRARQPEQLAFASGTARSVCTLATGAPTGGLDRAQLARCLRRYLGASEGELERAGVSAARSGAVLVAAAIMLLLMDTAGVGQAFVSDRGLRQGVALRHVLGASRVCNPRRRTRACRFISARRTMTIQPRWPPSC